MNFYILRKNQQQNDLNEIWHKKQFDYTKIMSSIIIYNYNKVFDVLNKLSNFTKKNTQKISEI